MTAEESAKEIAAYIAVWGNAPSEEHIAIIFNEAVAIERERCAQAAEAYRAENNGMLLYLSKEQVNDATCAAIAAAIREQA